MLTSLALILLLGLLGSALARMLHLPGALGIEGSYHALLSRSKSHPAGTDI